MKRCDGLAADRQDDCKAAAKACLDAAKEQVDKHFQ